jgi:hypothetical protein
MGESVDGMGKFVSGLHHGHFGNGYSFIGMQRADYMQGTRLSFRSKEDAIHFAEKQGVSLAFLQWHLLISLVIRRMGLLLAATYSEEDSAQELL